MTQQINKTHIELLEKIRSKTATIGVVGLGYVGLPLIRAFVESDFKTIGFDVDDQKIQQLLAGQSYIKHIESEWIASLIENGQFDPTNKFNHNDVKAFDILGLSIGIKWKIIKEKFKKLVKKYHPDMNAGNKKYEEKLKVITLAYTQLKNTYREKN